MDKDFLKNLPSTPGVYKMLDESRTILYIGKAGNLKKRVSSYFTKSNKSIKNQRLINKIKDIDYQITSNEQDALLLENNLIKEYRPKYNILLRDDKSYPYIFLNKDHSFPGFKFFRGKPQKGGQLFGPYTHVSNVRKILSILQKTFLVRLCEDSYFKSRSKPCLQYQIKRCSGPCVGLIDKEHYKKSIENAKMFLKGETSSLFSSLEKDMAVASEEQNYEVAAKHRDNIALIRDIASHYSIFPENQSIDFILSHDNDTKLLVDINIIRNGVNMGCKNYTFTKSSHEDINETLTSFFKQYYLIHIPPNLIISKDKILDKENIESVINKKYKQNSKIIHRIDKKYSDFINLCRTNLFNRSLKLLKKESSPLRNLETQLKIKIDNILCFDVSHISGSSAVGSAIFYDTNGKKIIEILKCKNTTVVGIHKGLNRLTKNDKVLDISYKDITEEINHDALTMIQSIRDEAHRFAIMNQRKRHNKLLFNSKLDGIPGIGDERKKFIINHFGGIQGVLKASIRDLKQVEGISEKLAINIYTYIHK